MLQLRKSAVGTKRPIPDVRYSAAIEGKADLARTLEKSTTREFHSVRLRDAAARG